jgi:hypothetical protein
MLATEVKSPSNSEHNSITIDTQGYVSSNSATLSSKPTQSTSATSSSNTTPLPTQTNQTNVAVSQQQVPNFAFLHTYLIMC